MDELPREIRLIERRAAARAGATDSGIGAGIVARLDDDEATGNERYRVRVSDGRLFGWVEVVTPPGQLGEGEIEAAVERLAGELPPDGRLLALEQRSPLLLR